ncbi:SDR family NAD(P)-dependent oxidoreductase [Nocardia sp. NPDC057455]|uniref:SDR family NAD(P)-dependent oxidoreductase n=1 Tax=Nocardia sp. NPDC057455 TaxID=3346138 RepID=UPI00366BCF25
MTETMIIGGGSGMGFALARVLVAEGVTIVGRSIDRLATARADLEQAGSGRVQTRRADIGREEDVAELFAGDQQVDRVAVTAADIAGS